MENENLYAFSPNEKQIEQLIHSNDSFTYCGLPLIGKTRILKKALTKMDLIDSAEFLNFSTVVNEEITSQTITDIINQLETFYTEGKRIFVLASMPFDNEYSEELLKQIFQFRQSKLKFPLIIPLLCTHPNFYDEITHFSHRLFSTIIYENTQNLKLFDFLILQNEARYNIKISNEDKSKIFDLTGGIAILIKEILKQISLNNFDFENIHTDSSIQYTVKEILDQLPNKEIDLYLRVINKKETTNFEYDYLRKIGILDSSDNFSSSLLFEGLSKYTRDYPINLLNGTIYINAKSSNNEFTDKELQVLFGLLSKNEIQREKVQEIIKSARKNTEEISEYSTDQFMSRLRKKLNHLGVSKNAIKTKKGMGYILVRE